MVQGKSKGLQKKAASTHSSAKSAGPKKGRRVIPPKKAAAVQHASIQQSLSSKINRSIEKQMISAASAGKLTIMRNEGESSNSKSRAKGAKR